MVTLLFFEHKIWMGSSQPRGAIKMFKKYVPKNIFCSEKILIIITKKTLLCSRKKKYFAKMVGPSGLEDLNKIKYYLDPENRLGAGNML